MNPSQYYFQFGKRPSTGMILSDDKGHRWKITKYGMPITLGTEGIKYKSPNNSVAVWDCSLSPVGHSALLREEQILEIVD